MDPNSNAMELFLGISAVLLVAIAITYYIVDEIRRTRRERAARKVREVPEGRLPFFVFAKILEPIGPFERGEKYENPLDQKLRNEKLGFTTGGGTMMSKEGAVEWVGIDIEVRDLERGLRLISEKLSELGAPPGSVLEYGIGAERKSHPIGS